MIERATRLKPQGQDWTVKEQILEDPVSGLTFQFAVVDTGLDGGVFRLRVFGDLPFGNREFIFNREGQEAGAGTAVASHLAPSWLHEVG